MDYEALEAKEHYDAGYGNALSAVLNLLEEAADNADSVVESVVIERIVNNVRSQLDPDGNLS